MLLRPFREVKHLECAYKLVDDSLTIDSWVNGRLANRLTVRTHQIIGIEVEGEVITLKQKFGAPIQLWNECFASEAERNDFLNRIREGSGLTT